jgi:hypothetical protein
MEGEFIYWASIILFLYVLFYNIYRRLKIKENFPAMSPEACLAFGNTCMCDYDDGPSVCGACPGNSENGSGFPKGKNRYLVKGSTNCGYMSPFVKHIMNN